MSQKLFGTMIDTETLSLGPRALIWEIACVPFSISVGRHPEDIQVETEAPLHALIDYKSLGTRGFDVDMGTLSWTRDKRGGEAAWTYWKETQIDDIAREDVPPIDVLTPAQLSEALSDLTGEGLPVWFRNAAFDVPAIDHLFSTAGAAKPWHRRQQSDLYTMINYAHQMFGFEDNLPLKAGHRALEDAVNQIDQLAHILAATKASGDGKES